MISIFRRAFLPPKQAGFEERRKWTQDHPLRAAAGFSIVLLPVLLLISLLSDSLSSSSAIALALGVDAGIFAFFAVAMKLDLESALERRRFGGKGPRRE
jgi:hypothetical protein